ncbi:MAG: hypothetical protein ACOCW6_09270 [Spirochaetota bacterium]
MREIVDLIIGAFIVFLPLFVLLLRRRRVLERQRPVEAPAEGQPGGQPGRALGPEPGRKPGGQPGRALGPEPGRKPGIPAPEGKLPAREAPVSKEAAPATAWERVNRLSPGRRAIVMAEIISKPLALRDRQPWS